MPANSIKCTRFLLWTLSISFGCLVFGVSSVHGQTNTSVIRGKIAYDPAQNTSWDNQKLFVPFAEIKAKLRQQIDHPFPTPPGFSDLTLEKRREWQQSFNTSEAGLKFQEERRRLLDAALVFDVKFEPDGTFVIYDVPAGVYGIQGRVDKEIGGTEYGFEVFGKIMVSDGVDEVSLQPLPVEITPLLKSGQKSPPLSVKSLDEGDELTLKSFEDDVVFICFWTATSPHSVAVQKRVQDMHAANGTKFNLKLLSINVDQDRKKAEAFITDQKLIRGQHGFTEGLEDRTLFDFGVRSFPSFWLIKDGKILMTQSEIAEALFWHADLTQTIADRLSGKDQRPPAGETDGKTDPANTPDK